MTELDSELERVETAATVCHALGSLRKNHGALPARPHSPDNPKPHGRR